MNIIIWGTGVQGKRLKEVCQLHGWKIKAFTDNNSKSWGEIEDIPIISPMELTESFCEDAQIWIAAKAPEIYAQAVKIDKNALPWDAVKTIIDGTFREYAFSSKPLEDKHIRNCQLLSNRNELLKKFAGKADKWEMAEIGVDTGGFSERIISICKPQKLYLVDAWEGERYGGGYIKTKERFKNEIEANSVEIRRGYSTDQLGQFMDGQLNWVYIDTVHDYDITHMELELCHKKTAKDGFICGHDYAKYNVYSRTDYGVFDAVNDFVIRHNYEFVYLTIEHHGMQSFCLKRKGEEN